MLGSFWTSIKGRDVGLQSVGSTSTPYPMCVAAGAWFSTIRILHPAGEHGTAQAVAWACYPKSNVENKGE